MNYWIITSKRKPRLWKPTKNGYYNYIYATKEDAEDVLMDSEKGDQKAIEVKMTIK